MTLFRSGLMVPEDQFKPRQRPPGDLNPARLLGVVLDDQLLLDLGVDLGPDRELVDEDAHLLGHDLKPRGNAALAGLRAGDDHRGQLKGLGRDLNDVVLAHAVRRDVDPAAVDQDVPVPDQLAGHVPALGEPGAVDHVVEAALQDLQQRLTRTARLVRGLDVVAVELLLKDAVDAAGLLLLADLKQVLAVLLADPAVLTRRVGTDLDRALRRVALRALEEKLDLLTAAQLAVRPGVTSHLCMSPQTRRRLGGRQPLCGTGVTSWMEPTSSPVACSDRIAVSRPEPGPLTKTSTLRMPCSMPRRAAASAACWAAYGVDLREPLNPTWPEDAHEITFPVGSVIETMVLLNVDRMWACPWATFFRSLRRTFFGAPACWLLLRGGICFLVPLEVIDPGG